uniref:Putative transglycosylase n=1 Tax=Streptomyces luridus TaxID=67320 RepID=D7PC12_STRLR|nr:putative transglycosylase [Streptomyces luridus]
MRRRHRAPAGRSAAHGRSAGGMRNQHEGGCLRPRPAGTRRAAKVTAVNGRSPRVVSVGHHCGSHHRPAGQARPTRAAAHPPLADGPAGYRRRCRRQCARQCVRCARHRWYRLDPPRVPDRHRRRPHRLRHPHVGPTARLTSPPAPQPRRSPGTGGAAVCHAPATSREN